MVDWLDRSDLAESRHTSGDRFVSIQRGSLSIQFDDYLHGQAELNGLSGDQTLTLDKLTGIAGVGCLFAADSAPVAP